MEEKRRRPPKGYVLFRNAFSNMRMHWNILSDCKWLVICCRLRVKRITQSIRLSVRKQWKTSNQSNEWINQYVVPYDNNGKQSWMLKGSSVCTQPSCTLAVGCSISIPAHWTTIDQPHNTICRDACLSPKCSCAVMEFRLNSLVIISGAGVSFKA